MADLRLDLEDRYARLRLIPWWNQERLLSSRVMVVGAGALGNEVLKNLALLGIGYVLVVDYDDIEASNLTRSVLFRARDAGRLKVEAAAEAVRDINPDCRVFPLAGDVTTDVGLGVFDEMDVVIGCLDNREARLHVNRSCWRVTTPWVDGGIQEISGVVKVFTPPDSSCYECVMTEADYKLIQLKYSCPLLKQEDILMGKTPTAPTISSIVAGLQTQEALKILHGLKVEGGAALVFHGVTNHFYPTRFPRREDCLSHETYPEAAPLPASAKTLKVGELLERASRDLGAAATLRLDRDFLVDLACERCGEKRPMNRPVQKVSQREAACPKCREISRTRIIHRIGGGEGFEERTLAEVGIPPFDIVRASATGKSAFYRLEGDRKAFGF